MQASRHPGRGLTALIIGGIAVLAAFALVLVVVPGSEPLILAVGLATGLALYGAMYLAQRQRHW